MLVYWKKKKIVESDASKWSRADIVFLWVLLSLAFFTPPSFCLLDCPSLPFSLRAGHFVLTLPVSFSSCQSFSSSPPPPPLCLGPVWVINYSWACSEGPGLLIPAHRGLALIQPVVQLNWKPSYTSYRHTRAQKHRAHTHEHALPDTPRTEKPHSDTHMDCCMVEYYTRV